MMFSDDTARLRWIRSSREIRSLRKRGRPGRGVSVFIWVLASGGDEPGTVAAGVVCGKGFRTAVDRNLAKRRARGCLLELRHELQEGRSYLVQCRPGSEKADYQLLVNEIRGLISNGRL